MSEVVQLIELRPMSYLELLCDIGEQTLPFHPLEMLVTLVLKSFDFTDQLCNLFVERIGHDNH